jgi:hypothetical protein
MTAFGGSSDRLADFEEYEALVRARIEHVVPVREPVALIAQIERSGGTLVSQLFDGHEECHAHPHELGIGPPRDAHAWPALDISAPPREWFRLLREKRAEKHFLRGGFKKWTGAEAPRLPFLFLPRLQKRIFEQCVSERGVTRERDIFDCYFTSYFNAWLNNQNLYSTPKKVITAFVPRLNMFPEQVERFFAAYPDGFLISLVRDPGAWYASEQMKRDARKRDLDGSLARWRASTLATFDARERYGSRVLILTYEQIVLETEATMQRVAVHLDISMTPTLLSPTFNGQPSRANSRAPVEQAGVLPERALAYRKTLDVATISRIEALAGELYERAVAAAGASRET